MSKKSERPGSLTPLLRPCVAAGDDGEAGRFHRGIAALLRGPAMDGRVFVEEPVLMKNTAELEQAYSLLLASAVVRKRFDQAWQQRGAHDGQIGRERIGQRNQVRLKPQVCSNT